MLREEVPSLEVGSLSYEGFILQGRKRTLEVHAAQMTAPEVRVSTRITEIKVR